MATVLLATRPLTPPWDEASKNFGYFLGTAIVDHALTLLTVRGNEMLKNIPDNNSLLPVYSSAHLGLRQKWELIATLRKQRRNFDITHYLYTPTPQNVNTVQRFAKPGRGHTVQTIATVRDDLYNAEQLQKLYFADSLVTYTRAAEAKVRALGLSNVQTIYPGIDLSKYSPGEKNTEWLQSMNIPDAALIVSYPGEYTRLGCTDYLADWCIHFFGTEGKSAEEINQTKNVYFLWACRVKNEADAKKKEEVRAKLAAAGVLGQVRFTDTVPDMPSLYRSSDIVAFPVFDLLGKFDVPLIIIEAYACGRSVILSDLPNFAEFSDPSYCAIIPKGNEPALTQKILELSQNQTYRESLETNARAFATKYFDGKQTAAAYSRLYTELGPK